MKNIELEKRVCELTADLDSCHDFSHTLRVIELARKIALVEGGNQEIIYLASLLHDIGRIIRNRSKHHAVLGAEMARDILSDFAFEENKINQVVQAIASHSKSAGIPCQSLEAKILYDADKVDALGAIGLARLFADAGSKDIPLYDYLPNLKKKGICTDLLREDRQIVESLYTVTGRRLAEKRYNFEEMFLGQMEREIGRKI